MNPSSEHAMNTRTGAVIGSEVLVSDTNSCQESTSTTAVIALNPASRGYGTPR